MVTTVWESPAMSEQRPTNAGLDLRPFKEECVVAKRELLRPTAEEIEALQPTAEEVKEIEEIETLQAIARRYLGDPEEAERVRPAARSTLSDLEYLGLYVALALREPGMGEATDAAADENLYALCVNGLTRSRAGDTPVLPGDTSDIGPPAPLDQEPAAKPIADETGGPSTEAAVYENLLRERDARLAGKDREIGRLTQALEEAQAALLRQEQELLSRVQAQIALLALQQTEETQAEEEPQQPAGAPPPPKVPPAAEKRPWWRRKET